MNEEVLSFTNLTKYIITSIVIAHTKTELYIFDLYIHVHVRIAFKSKI